MGPHSRQGDPVLIDETGEAIDARARVVARALGELGEQDPDKYYDVVAPQFSGGKNDHAISWCGIGALWCLVMEGLCTWNWETGRGFVYRLKTLSLPLPGDIAIFRKGATGKDLWHHAIVKDYGNGKVNTVDANVLPYPKEGWAEKTRPIDTNVTFYSIATLIS